MGFFDLADRQVVYLLKYMRDSLRTHTYIANIMNGEVVESVMARPCFNRIVYKGEPRWILDANRLPVLAIWREGNKTDELGYTECDAQICWYGQVPAGIAEHDPSAVGQTLGSNMWHVVREKINRLMEDPDLAATKLEMAVGSVFLGAGSIELDADASVCGFSADLRFKHEKPPYDIDDPDNLAKVMIDLKLYDSSTVDDDGIQGDYLGLTEEAEIEPEA